jgi:uncharacterized OsmC-like protein
MSIMSFSASTRWTGAGVGADVAIRNHRLVVDEPAELGGSDAGPNPVELVLAGLGSCMCVLAAIFAPHHDVVLEDFRVDVEGDLDPDGLQRLAEVRPGFLEIRYRFAVKSPSPPERVDALLDHIQRACPVKDTLAGVPVRPLAGEVAASHQTP